MPPDWLLLWSCLVQRYTNMIVIIIIIQSTNDDFRKHWKNYSQCPVWISHQQYSHKQWHILTDKDYRRWSQIINLSVLKTCTCLAIIHVQTYLCSVISLATVPSVYQWHWQCFHADNVHCRLLLLHFFRHGTHSYMQCHIGRLIITQHTMSKHLLELQTFD